MKYNRVTPVITSTVYLPLKTQGAMQKLLQRLKGRISMAEYGFSLILESKGSNLLPGIVRAGYRGHIGTSVADTAPGFFHTHPQDSFPPGHSETDTIGIFLLHNRRISGVGHPDYSADKVSFITLTRPPPPKVISEILDNLPGIYEEDVHLSELEEFYTTYEFTLGVELLSMQVLLNWHPPKLPSRWWKPKETLEEYLQRKLPE